MQGNDMVFLCPVDICRQAQRRDLSRLSPPCYVHCVMSDFLRMLFLLESSFIIVLCMRNVINHVPTPFGLSVSSVECLSVINHASTIYMNKFNKMLVLTANTADIFQRVIFETKNTCFCHYIKYTDNQCDRLFLCQRKYESVSRIAVS